MKSFFPIIRFAVVAALISGCSTVRAPEKKPPVIKAVFTTEPVTVDGRLEEKAWDSAPAYQLALAGAAYKNQPDVVRRVVGLNLRESGEVRLLWDSEYVYIGIKFVDSDLYAYGETDNLHHYNFGDVAEVFIKPLNETYYWELYTTPTGQKTSFFIPGRGSLIMPALSLETIAIRSASASQGTINHWLDRDEGWTSEMAVPRASLEKYGARLEPGASWTIFFARYNYSRYLPIKELSSFPKQADIPYFNAHEEYGTLELIK